VDDQKIRLILETLGADDIARLRVMLGEVRAEGPQAAAALGQTQMAAAALGEQAETAADKVDRVDTASKKASGGVAGFGQSALQTGRVVQDFAQGGIGGVLNNIEGLTMALGLGSGLAGVLTIAGVAALVAGPQIKAFFSSFGATKEADESVEGLKKRVKELEDNPARVAIETRELDIARDKLENLKKSLAAFDAEQNKQSEAEAASGKAIERAITESGPGAEEVSRKVVADTVRRLTAQSQAGGAIARGEAMQREGREQLAAAAEGFDQSPEGMIAASAAARAAQAQIDAGKKAVVDAQLAIIEQAKRLYGDQLRAMERGHREGQAVATEDFAAQLRGVGEGELATQIEASTPKALAARQEYETRVEEESSATDIEFEAGIKNIKSWSAGQKAKARKGAAFDKEAADWARWFEKGEAAEGAKAVETEQGRIQRTVGAPWQRQYELAMAGNAEALASGQGGVDPARLGRQLQAQMAARLRQRGASEGAATGAARGIAGKGDEDLGRRAADASATNLSIAGQTLMISRQLIGEYQRQNGTQRELMREAQAQQRSLRMTKKSPLGR
jgi:hypothetical protein